MPDVLDVFKSDAFGVIALTDAINKMPHVPGRLGGLGLFDEVGIDTTTVMIEEREGVLTLVPTSERGAPGKPYTPPKRGGRPFSVPHITHYDAIKADELQNVRLFGSGNQMEAIQTKVDERLTAMGYNLDATMEWHRIGAMKGIIYDADGTTVVANLFTGFGVTQDAEIDFDLDNASPASGAVRKNINKVLRSIQDTLGLATFRYVHCMCGSAFFDDLVSHKEIADAYARWSANGSAGGQGEFLRQEIARRSFPYAGVIFEEYRGKVGTTDFVNTDKAHFFPVGSPGLFKTYFAPADYVEAVNTLGLPRYAKAAIDAEFQKFVKMEAQTNPLNLCTRPKVLIQAKRT